MDGLSFSNSLTVEQNVLAPGQIAHILRNRVIDSDTYALTDSWFHYDQVGSVMLASNSAGTAQTYHYQDAWGNVMSDWTTGLWESDQSGWHHNTKATDGDLGLVYMYQRWYNSEVSTFVSSAPYAPHIEHRYSFTVGDPVGFLDPRGTFLCIFSKCCRLTKKMKKYKDACDAEFECIKEKYEEFSDDPEWEAEIEYIAKYGGGFRSTANINCIIKKAYDGGDNGLVAKWIKACNYTKPPITTPRK